VYDALTKDLTADEKTMITSVFQEGEQKALEAEAQRTATLRMQPTNGV